MTKLEAQRKARLKCVSVRMLTRSQPADQHCIRLQWLAASWSKLEGDQLAKFRRDFAKLFRA